jgi:glycosyltransferase involved in cell wall biosynthesis
MSNTVSLCMICKNESNNIAGLMDDVCPVLEEIIVVDTGSTDGTLKILEGKKEQYPNLQVHHFDWVHDFSAARNYAFSLAGDVDWIFWVDGDDRVNQEALKHFKDHVLDNPNVDAWILPYIYSKYPDGSPQTYLSRERFLRKSRNPKWIGAIHETVDIFQMRQANHDNPKIEHNTQGKQIEPRRNLKILAKEFEKNPNDHRTAYYYAKELFDHIDPAATEKLVHYINLPCKYWDDEIGARFRLAKTYVAEGKYRDALLTVDPIYHLDGTRRRSEYYFIYGEVEYRLKNYDVAIAWYERCLTDPPGAPRVLSLEYWTWHPLKKIAECYKELGNWEKCYEYAERVSSILPGDYGTKVWMKELQGYKLQAKPNYKLVTLELGTNTRWDSYKYGLEPFKVATPKGEILDVSWSFADKLPLAENSLDGVVWDNEVKNIANEKVSYTIGTYPVKISEVGRVIKPCGFLWTKYAIKEGHEPPLHLFNFLGRALYQGQYYFNYVRIDDNKPIVSYSDCNEGSGPYRYRIKNLIQSARKAGYPVIAFNSLAGIIPDVYVDLQLRSRVGKINVVEVCEKLDNYSIGVEHADVINCSSKLLADWIKEKYPNKTVINIDDHFEMPVEGWL